MSRGTLLSAAFDFMARLSLAGFARLGTVCVYSTRQAATFRTRLKPAQAAGRGLPVPTHRDNLNSPLKTGYEV